MYSQALCVIYELDTAPLHSYFKLFDTISKKNIARQQVIYTHMKDSTMHLHSVIKFLLYCNILNYVSACI